MKLKISSLPFPPLPFPLDEADLQEDQRKISGAVPYQLHLRWDEVNWLPRWHFIFDGDLFTPY